MATASRKPPTGASCCPCSLHGGRRIDVLTYVIQGAARILIGRPLLEKLGLIVDYNKQLMRWSDQEWEPAPRGPKDEYILHLGQDLCRCRHREPDMVLMPEDIDGHIGQPVSMQTFSEERKHRMS